MWRRSSLGFSAIELMITVSIMVIMLAAVAPGISDWLANARLRGVADVALTGLQKARAEAIKRNQVVTFWLVSSDSASALDDSCVLSATSPSWVISLDNPAGACAAAPSPDTVPRIIEARSAGSGSSGVEVYAANEAAVAASQVSFDGFGQLVALGPVIRTIDFSSTSSGQRPLRVEISLAGAVRMCVHSAEVVSPDPRACQL
jgi:type IV fimbrial biogenesis protein FimT